MRAPRRGRTRGTIATGPGGGGTSTSLAIPKGPASGFSQAADFYDSVGIAHHPEYLADADMDTAITRLQELNLRHVRLGMFSPANHGARDFYYRSGNFGVKLAQANASRPGSTQPIFALWGTTEEPLFEAPRGSAVYTIGNAPSTTSSTFTRPLDGPAGTVPSPVQGQSLYPFAHTSQKDDFNRSGPAGTTGGLGGNWGNDPFGQGFTAPRYIIEPMPYGLDGFWAPATTTGESASHWTQQTFTGGDLEAWVLARPPATSAGSYISVGLVQQPGVGTADGYQLVARTDTNQWTLYRWDNGTRTVIAGPVAQPVLDYDRVGIEVKNGTVTGYRFADNGAVADSQKGRWLPIVSTVDATYTFPSGANLVLAGKDTTNTMRLENFGGGSTSLLENAGDYSGQGWTTAAGLQGPNEPDNNRTTMWDSLRTTMRALKDAKNARTSTVVMGGEDYIDSTTGRITAGPAHAPQLPAVAFHLVGNDWGKAGDYTNGDADAGTRHIYWGGHEPNYTEMSGMWDGTASYNGQLSGGARGPIPYMVTETGYEMRPGYDEGPGRQRHCPEDVSGEYLIRTLIHHYLYGIRRTYIYKLSDESSTLVAPWVFGLTDVTLARRAAFYAIKNLLALVGWTQGAAGSPPPFTVTGFTPGANNQHADGYTSADRLNKLVLKRTDTEYLVILARDRMLWDRATQAYVTVSDPQTVQVALPANWVNVSVAEPAKNTIQSPNDGRTYANPTNGTAYTQLTPAGNTVSLQVAGLTRVVKVTTT